jgi:hypothetical protein
MYMALRSFFRALTTKKTGQMPGLFVYCNRSKVFPPDQSSSSW